MRNRLPAIDELIAGHSSTASDLLTMNNSGHNLSIGRLVGWFVVNLLLEREQTDIGSLRMIGRKEDSEYKCVYIYVKFDFMQTFNHAQFNAIMPFI